MKILVTGATGFIGNYVIDYLLSIGIKIIATSRSLEKAKNSNWFGKVEFIPWTIGFPEPDDLFQQFGSPNLCIHLAWSGLSNFKDPKHKNVYFKNHYNFLKNLASQGVKKFSVTGTCLEYGMKEGALSENMTPNPTIPYSIAKNDLRLALEKLQKKHEFNLDWIRLFYMFGKGQNPKSILATLEKHINEKQTIFNMSGGEQVRDYLPVEIIAEFIVNLALQIKGNGIVNCCSGSPIKIVDLVKNYLAERNASIDLNLGYYPYTDYEPFEFWGSAKKLNITLNNAQ